MRRLKRGAVQSLQIEYVRSCSSRPGQMLQKYSQRRASTEQRHISCSERRIALKKHQKRVGNPKTMQMETGMAVGSSEDHLFDHSAVHFWERLEMPRVRKKLEIQVRTLMQQHAYVHAVEPRR